MYIVPAYAPVNQRSDHRCIINIHLCYKQMHVRIIIIIDKKNFIKLKLDNNFLIFTTRYLKKTIIWIIKSFLLDQKLIKYTCTHWILKYDFFENNISNENMLYYAFFYFYLYNYNNLFNYFILIKIG